MFKKEEKWLKTHKRQCVAFFFNVTVFYLHADPENHLKFKTMRVMENSQRLTNLGVAAIQEF